MLDEIYKQLTALQKQLDNLIRPEIPTIAELVGLFLLRANNLSDVASAVTSFTNIKQDATETATGVVERATQTEVNTGTDTTRYVSPATLSGRTATTTRTGIAELATQAEVDAGTDTDRIVTPATLAAYPKSLPHDGRLTLTSGTPVLTGDVTGATTIYLAPYLGNRTAVYTGSAWLPMAFSEISVAVPSTVYRLFDIFEYNNAGTLALETVNWNQSTAAITAASNATPIVITSNGHGLSNNDRVAVAGVLGNTAANGIWSVQNVAANTFELEGSTGSGAYTSGGTWYKLNATRATAITLQDGRYVKSGDTGKHYRGTGMTTGTSGQTEMVFTAPSSFLLWNYYNKIDKRAAVDDTTSHTYTSAATRIYRNINTNKIQTVVGVGEADILFTLACAYNFDAGDGTVFTAANLNRSGGLISLADGISDVFEGRYLTFIELLSTTAGHNFIQLTQQGAATSPDFVRAILRGQVQI